MQNLLAYLPWLWLGVIVVGSALCELLWFGVVVLRAADVDYDPQRCASRRPKINLAKALRRRVTWPRLELTGRPENYLHPWWRFDRDLTYQPAPEAVIA